MFGVLVWKNLLLCAHPPIGGENLSNRWILGGEATTQSGFFRTIGKRGRRVRAVPLYCFCMNSTNTWVVFYMNFQCESVLILVIGGRAYLSRFYQTTFMKYVNVNVTAFIHLFYSFNPDQFHEICQTASTAHTHLAERTHIFCCHRQSLCFLVQSISRIDLQWLASLPQFEM